MPHSTKWEGTVVALYLLAMSTFQVSLAVDQAGSYPVGDRRNCPTASPQVTTQPLYSMDVLPGLGFDALRSIELGQVLDYNYSLCRVSKDGKYLLPDNVYLTPVRQSSVEVFADFYDHWDKVTSLTSKSISAHASVGWGFAEIGGSFSYEHTSTKSHMVNDDSSVVRIHLRDTLYTVHAQPRSSLHPDFKSRLFEIAAYLQKNITDHAHYLAELLIRDYGTHYLSSVEAGAIIAQTDFVANKYAEDQASDSTKIKASASASFFGSVFSAGGGISTTSISNHTYDDGYIKNRTFSKIDTIGGPPYRINFTIDQWEDGIPGALVPVDRSGDPLHFVINSNTVPELPHSTRAAVADVVLEANKRYFKVNTHTGCTNPKSKHFDSNANIDDKISCDSEIKYNNYTFGGTYQQCTGSTELCRKYETFNQPNPLTHGYGCPDNTNYLPVKMFSGVIDLKWTTGFWFFKRSHEERATYTTYWCVARPEADIPENSGFLFGGFYTESTPNPATETMGCPRYYTPLKVGNYMKVCVSTDFELGFRYSIPFGGFESCQSGNPLARETFSEETSSWPHECPHGYTRYFGGVEHGCDVNLCVKSGTLKLNTYYGQVPPRLPPFHVHTLGELNDTETLTFVGSDGKLRTRSWLGEWKTKEADSQCFADVTTQQEYTMETPAYTTQDDPTTQTGVPLQTNNGPSAVAITVPTVLFGVVITCVIAILIVVIVRRAYHSKLRKGYNNMHLVNDQPTDVNTPA